MPQVSGGQCKLLAPRLWSQTAPLPLTRAGDYTLQVIQSSCSDCCTSAKFCWPNCVNCKSSASVAVWQVFNSYCLMLTSFIGGLLDLLCIGFWKAFSLSRTFHVLRVCLLRYSSLKQTYVRIWEYPGWFPTGFAAETWNAEVTTSFRKWNT